MSKDTDFLRQQQEAIERMREMSRRSTDDSAHAMPPIPPFVKLNGQNVPKDGMNTNAYLPNSMHTHGNDGAAQSSTHQNSAHTNKQGFEPLSNIPFLSKIGSEPDVALVLGLLLLLWSEKADKRLLLALLYIVF